ncbi:hypothetical protein PC129_g23591 [Phytophthora cactorum]|uniref:Uncharacterized protein n=2 Tax=Phytophthora cactorum TaxID=29920 RepID=A0A329SQA8_9STRA|nr:hypothetical protein Pcac1_g4080 [Phytophthora cactorum]KAG2792554.1 hypothetical protein PC111_g23414 [Phytophthora cactorum]KAG2792691.1 hypothetical protein PC112_g23757 [Phytophthora cactorum]KAG2812099.1 hypothetical protein PC113_g23593 [Phytophthora cactorum]KAG2881410.1 hypothetical protein PC117_g26395 [Phytophthora cactorum]
MPRRQYATVDDVDMEDMIENDKEEEKLSGIPMGKSVQTMSTLLSTLIFVDLVIVREEV